MINTKKYLKGLKAGIGMGIAYIPFGLTVGLIAKNNGMYTIVTAAMSFGIYAGGLGSNAFENGLCATFYSN